MLISYNKLKTLNAVYNTSSELINPASIDLRLNSGFLVEKKEQCIVNLAKKSGPNLHAVNDDKILLAPGKFCLAHTIEVFDLPLNVSCQFLLKSSIARAGLECLHSGWCDAGWHGSTFTMALKNMLQYQSILIEKGMKIGQMMFFEHEDVPVEQSYAVKGRYNSVNLSGSKGV